MRILKPGQSVILHEGTKGEPSSEIRGRINELCIFGDGSIRYGVTWWAGYTKCHEYFNPSAFNELDDAEYLELEPARIATT